MSETRRVLVTGDRNWDTRPQREAVRAFIAGLPSGTLVIHGGATGVDYMAGRASVDRGLPTIEMQAPWEFFKKAAGPIRNQWMLDFCAPTECHAFHDNIAASKGTRDMVSRCRKAGIPVTLHTSQEGESVPPTEEA